MVQHDCFGMEFGVGCRSRGIMSVTTTCSFGGFSCSFKPRAITPSAMSCGLSPCMLLVPHSKTATRRNDGRERCPLPPQKMLYETPPIPQLIVIKGFMCSFHTAGYRANPLTIQSPEIATRACCLIILLAQLHAEHTTEVYYPETLISCNVT